MRLAATLEFLRAVDYPFPDWAEEYMSRMEEALGDAYTEPVADVPAATSTTCARRVGEPRLTEISEAFPDRVVVRGRDLSGDLMGRVGFTEYVHLLLTGDEPTDDQRFFLDLLLVSIAEDGLMPSNVAARMPSQPTRARCRSRRRRDPRRRAVVLGASEECARLLSGRVGGGTRARRRSR